MKLEARLVAGFLRDPGATRVVLLHGEDEGMIRQRAEALTVAVAGARDDPFRVAWLAREDHGRLAEEATAIAMLGGRRVVRVREAADALAGAVAQVAGSPGDTLVVLEAAGALPARSKLRSLVEGMQAGAVIACYPEEGRALQERIAAALTGAGVRADSDALAYVAERVGADSGAVAGAIEKLVLYAGEERRLDLDGAQACVGDAGSAAFDDAVFAAMAGNVRAADRALELALAEGTAAVAIVRGVLQHLARLHQTRGDMAQGASAEAAIARLRPPVFFKRAAEFGRALRLWDASRLAAAMAEARRVELMCKQTGAADQLLVRRLLAALARQASRQAG